jgi:serine/threonine protein kinase
VPGYEILGLLGRGGMGVVYKARHLKLNRVVALKMLGTGAVGDAGDYARLQAEAEALARLQHPHIVQIYEIGEHDGAPFLALEFCPGGSLDVLLKHTTLPPREAASLAETLARATHAAHEAGIVHRDLKPGNVLLQKTEDRGQRTVGREGRGPIFCPLSSVLCPLPEDHRLRPRPAPGR